MTGEWLAPSVQQCQVQFLSIPSSRLDWKSLVRPKGDELPWGVESGWKMLKISKDIDRFWKVRNVV